MSGKPILVYHQNAKLLIVQHEGKTKIIRAERAEDRMMDLIVIENFPVEVELTGAVLTFTRLERPTEWP